jgi:hypothetical protein
MHYDEALKMAYDEVWRFFDHLVVAVVAFQRGSYSVHCEFARIFAGIGLAPIVV